MVCKLDTLSKKIDKANQKKGQGLADDSIKDIKIHENQAAYDYAFKIKEKNSQFNGKDSNISDISICTSLNKVCINKQKVDLYI